MSKQPYRIALITDSTSDLPQNLRDEYCIYVAPLYLLWGNEQYRDGVDITAEEFYERLPRSTIHPTTSQPTPGDFMNLLEQAKRDGAEEAVIITISDKLSGTYDSALQAAEMEDIPVHVFDSRSVSMGLGFQVLAAARARDAGGDAQAMLAAAEKVRQHINIIFTVDTLEYLHRGGRIGGAAKLIGTALQLKPQLIMSAESGVIEAGAKVRTRKKALESVFTAFVEKLNGHRNLHITVLHVCAQEEAEQLAKRLQDQYHVDELIITSTSPVIGAHAGPGTVGVVGYAEVE
ncbi:MAG: DegV family protein [Aggregatilineales bacterium]|nr:DegV family protein [Aggregatilineales bacterium]